MGNVSSYSFTRGKKKNLDISERVLKVVLNYFSLTPNRVVLVCLTLILLFSPPRCGRKRDTVEETKRKTSFSVNFFSLTLLHALLPLGFSIPLSNPDVEIEVNRTNLVSNSVCCLNCSSMYDSQNYYGYQIHTPPSVCRL